MADIGAGEKPASLLQPGNWALTIRVLFRFAFAYFILAALQQFAIASIALLHDRWMLNAWRRWSTIPALWTATHIFRFTDFDSTLRVSDSVAGWSGVALNVILAASAAVVWSTIDRKRDAYRRLHEWLRLVVRFGLGLVLVDYGAQKIFSVQMPLIRPHQLLGMFGSYAPAQLLWAFIGASRGYETFTGCVELLSGVLLFVPRLTTAGAILGFAALVQVFALNAFYDIQVKRFSLELLVSALFLLIPDMRRLIDFFVFNRATVPVKREPLFRALPMARRAVAAQVVLGLILTANALWFYDRFAPVTNVFDTDRVQFYGIWDVESFSTGGVIRPPLTTDSVRWQRVVFDDYYNSAFIQRMNGEIVGIGSRADAVGSKVTFSYAGDRRAQREDALGRIDAEFAVEAPTADSLVLRGRYNGEDATFTLRRSSLSFALQPHDTHWILRRPSTSSY